MAERPILFNGAMVRAILSGAKTQTRRVIKEQPFDRSWARHDHRIHYMAGRASNGDEVDGLWAYSASSGGEWMAKCPFGQPGDRLWVRESFADLRGTGIEHRPDPAGPMQRYAYAADTPAGTAGDYQRREYGIKWRPSIHMPREACRLVLEITAVRVERLQAISEADALAEGVELSSVEGFKDAGMERPSGFAFRDLWISTGGDWDGNPWVWVIEFMRVRVAGD